MGNRVDPAAIMIRIDVFRPKLDTVCSQEVASAASCPVECLFQASLYIPLKGGLNQSQHARVTPYSPREDGETACDLREGRDVPVKRHWLNMFYL